MPTTQTIVVTGALAVIIGGGAGYFIGEQKNPGVNVRIRGKDGKQEILNINGSPIEVSEGSVDVSNKWRVQVTGGIAKINQSVFEPVRFSIVNCKMGTPPTRCQVSLSSGWSAKLTRGGATVDDIVDDNVGNVVFTPDPAYPFSPGSSYDAYQNTSFDAARVNGTPLSCSDSSDPAHCKFEILYCFDVNKPCN
jgi:hypothetical protein